MESQIWPDLPSPWMSYVINKQPHVGNLITESDIHRVEKIIAQEPELCWAGFHNFDFLVLKASSHNVVKKVRVMVR